MSTINQAILFNAGISFDEVQQAIQNNTLLKHKSGVKFQYICDFKPQFSSTVFAKLVNLKSGKVECFNANTYLKFFKVI